VSANREMPAHHKPPVPPGVQRAAAIAQQAFEAQLETQEATNADGSSASAEPSTELPPVSPTEPSAAPTTVVQASPVDTVDWQHKFNSLKGKHDAEISRMAAEIDGLQRVLSGILTAPQAAQGPGAPAQPDEQTAFDFNFRPISNEEREDYGEEFLSVAERAAAQRFAPMLKHLTDKVARLEQGVNQVSTSVQADARADLYRHLAHEVPDYAALDRDPLFIDWLRYPDQFSGVPRQVLLDKAVEENNGPRVVAFFKAYQELQAGAVAPTSPAASPAPAPAPRAAPRTSLETLAAPGRGRPGTSAGTPAQTGNDAVYSQSQIAKFYEDVRRGIWRNDPVGKARREADIVRAATEGRVMAG